MTRKRAHPPRTRAAVPGPAPDWDAVLAHQRAGRPAVGLAVLDAQLRGNPDLASHAEPRRLRVVLHADLAEVREAGGDVAAAERDLRAALSFEPTFPDFHQRLGRVLLRRGDMQGARACFDEAVRLAPGYAAARLEI